MTFLQPPQLNTLTTALPLNNIPHQLPTEAPKLPKLQKPPSLALPKFPALPHIPSDTATLWALVQNKFNGFPTLQGPQFGINSALSVLQNGNLSALNHEGYVDINRDLGFEYSIQALPNGSISGDIEVEAVLPNKLTVGHQVRVHQQRGSFQAKQATRLSLPILNNQAVAQLRVKQHGEDAHAISFELGNKKSDDKNKNLLTGKNSTESNDKNTAESDAEDAYFTTSAATKTSDVRIPQIKLEVERWPHLSSTAASFLNINWQQAWTKTLRTCALYQSRANRLQIDARARVHETLLVSAGAAGDLDSIINRAIAKLLWKPKSLLGIRAKHALQVESRFTKGVGGCHSVKLRRRPAHKDSGPEASIAVVFTQGKKNPAFNFDVYVPT